jgi:predicted nuclease with TOPRIM domain
VETNFPLSHRYSSTLEKLRDTAQLLKSQADDAHEALEGLRTEEMQLNELLSKALKGALHTSESPLELNSAAHSATSLQSSALQELHVHHRPDFSAIEPYSSALQEEKETIESSLKNMVKNYKNRDEIKQKLIKVKPKIIIF